MTVDQVKYKVRVLSMDAFGGLGNRKPLSVVPNDVAMLGVNISLFQHHPENIEHLDGELPLMQADPVGKVIDQGLLFKGLSRMAFSDAPRTSLPRYVWRAALIFRRLCSMPRSTHSPLNSLKRW